MVVTLNWYECAYAAQAGVRRRLLAIRDRRGPVYGEPGPKDLWGLDIESCAAELAVAKAFGRYWTPVAENATLVDEDVSGLQVRSTARLDGCLILHPRDEGLFVLAVGWIPTFRLLGPVEASVVKRAEFWREDTGRPAFFVPQAAISAEELAAMSVAS